ncbi:hypothetical protein BJ165DRAFT_1340289 [Panaeolus papilionaceus]|nr:hypothetical protein BJ165DRAFT_1340289 [Panaeolus papilionaceus]
MHSTTHPHIAPNTPTSLQSILSSTATPIPTSASTPTPTPTSIRKPTRTAFRQFSLLGRVILVTGAHRGLGLESALVLAEAGGIVYCLDLPQQPNEEWLKVKSWVDALDELGGDFVGKSNDTKRKGRLEYVTGDVRDQKAMEEIAERIVMREGRIDVCVANAAIMGSAPCLDYPGDEITKILETNVKGTLFTAQAVGKQMVKLGIRGSIILMASLAGSLACRGIENIGYSISKAAIIQMARSMASELGSKGIRVNSVSPSYTMTEMVKAAVGAYPTLREMTARNPLDRIAMAEEMRGVVLWLASDASSFSTGSDIIVDGGFSAW